MASCGSYLDRACVVDGGGGGDVGVQLTGLGVEDPVQGGHAVDVADETTQLRTHAHTMRGHMQAHRHTHADTHMHISALPRKQ